MDHLLLPVYSAVCYFNSLVFSGILIPLLFLYLSFLPNALPHPCFRHPSASFPCCQAVGRGKSVCSLCERATEIIQPHLLLAVDSGGKWKYSLCVASEKAISYTHHCYVLPFVMLSLWDTHTQSLISTKYTQ